MNELTWADVVAVLQGLRAFYAERGRWVGLLVCLQDGRRGALGDAYVGSGDEGSVDPGGDGRAEGAE